MRHLATQKGASASAYALLIGLVSIGAISAVLTFGDAARRPFTIAANLMASRPTASSPDNTPPLPADPPTQEDPVEHTNLEMVPLSGAAWWERAQGGRSNMGTIAHIGGGIFLTHNHGRHPSSPTQSKNMVVMPGQDGQQTVPVLGVYNFSPGDDIRAWRATDKWQNIPALPLMVAMNPADLLHKQGRVVGWPMVQGVKGVLWKSAGAITAASWGSITLDSNISGGMSGSLLTIEASWPGVGAGLWSVGTLATASGGSDVEVPEGFPVDTSPIYEKGNYTAMNPTRYAGLVDTFAGVAGFEPSAVASVLLLGSQTRGAGLTHIEGTDWPETIVSGIEGGTINPGGGTNRIHITGTGANTIILPNRAGSTIVSGLRVGQDALDMSQISNPVKEHQGPHTLWRWQGANGPASLLVENATL